MKSLLKRSVLENAAVDQNGNHSYEEMMLLVCSVCSHVLFAAFEYSYLCQYLSGAGTSAFAVSVIIEVYISNF